MERLIRREIPPRTSSVMVDSVPQDRLGFLLGLVEVKRNCNAEEATKTIAAAPPITIAEGLTKGEAQALVEQLARRCHWSMRLTEEMIHHSLRKSSFNSNTA